MTVAVTLYALLELYKQGEATWTQDEPFAEITVEAPASSRPAARDPRARGRMTDELERTLEALLFLSAEPVPATALAEATGAELDEVVTALERLRERYEFERRGLVLRQLAGGYALSSHPDAEPAARRLLARPRTPPLTSAQAETLAIVAYLQPVSRPEIARIRGVSAESAAATLLERGMIEEAGRSQFGAVLYRTTELFLKLFGLESLDELPEIAGSTPRPSSSRSCASGCCGRARRARQALAPAADRCRRPCRTPAPPSRSSTDSTRGGRSGAAEESLHRVTLARQRPLVRCRDRMKRCQPHTGALELPQADRPSARMLATSQPPAGDAPPLTIANWLKMPPLTTSRSWSPRTACARAPSDQQRLKRPQQARLRQLRGRRADHRCSTSPSARSCSSVRCRPSPIARVAQRQPRPARQIARRRRVRGRPGSGGRARPARDRLRWTRPIAAAESAASPATST